MSFGSGGEAPDRGRRRPFRVRSKSVATAHPWATLTATPGAHLATEPQDRGCPSRRMKAPSGSARSGRVSGGRPPAMTPMSASNLLRLPSRSSASIEQVFAIAIRDDRGRRDPVYQLQGSAKGHAPHQGLHQRNPGMVGDRVCRAGPVPRRLRPFVRAGSGVQWRDRSRFGAGSTKTQRRHAERDQGSGPAEVGSSESLRRLGHRMVQHHREGVSQGKSGGIPIRG